MTTEKTSDILDRLEQQKEALLMVRESIVMHLEDDGRLEDLQIMYKDRAHDNLAKVILAYWASLRDHAHPIVIERHREIVDMSEAIYRLVK